jgi:hypothetical protein
MRVQRVKSHHTAKNFHFAVGSFQRFEGAANFPTGDGWSPAILELESFDFMRRER